MYSDFRSTLIYPDPKNRGMRGPAVNRKNSLEYIATQIPSLWLVFAGRNTFSLESKTP